MPFPNRRTFLKSALAGVAGVSRVQAQRTILSTPLSDNVFLLTRAGANVVARAGADGVVLVDGGLAERAVDLAKAVFLLPGAGPVHTLFNTHWHPEQTGSNLALGRAGATIIAHENTRLRLTQEITRPGENRTHKPFPKEALPNKTFYGNGSGSGSIIVDGEHIEYGYLLQAHTDGDIYVFFPTANVLVIGDVIAGEGWPMIDWWTRGSINGIVSGLDTLLAVANEKTRVVAGQGPVLTKADLDTQRKMFNTIAQRLRTIMNKSKNPDDAIAEQPTKEFDERMGDPKQFIRTAFQSMWPHVTPDP
jgi:cyclase